MATEKGNLQGDSELISQNTQTKLPKSKVLGNLESQENCLASMLRESTDRDLESTSDVLQHLGVVYHLRGLITKEPLDFVKASALFNSSTLRTKDKEKNEILHNLINRNENIFLLKMLNIRNTDPPATFKSTVQEKLNTLRTNIEKKLEEVWQYIKVNFSIHAAKQLRIEEEKSLVKKVKSLSKYTSMSMKLFFKDVLNECYKILGPSPQSFAVVGLGSLAREEMTPYSDLEFVILIEDDSKDKQYFRNLTHLFQLFVINLSETPLPALGIKSLNDFDKKNGDWFYDSVTTNGICFDGAMPWACKTPIGLPDREFKSGIELIETPTKMSRHVHHKYALKEGYHLAEILRTTTLIDGCSELLDKFVNLCSGVGNDIDIKYDGLNRLRQDAKHFGKNPLLDKLMNRVSQQNLQNFVALQHVKKEIYRLPSIITNDLKLIYNLSTNSPWDLLEEMTGHPLSEDDSRSLQVAVSIAVLLRLKTYIKNRGQKETLSFLKQAATNTSLRKDEIKAYFCDNEQLIFRFYFTTVPLIYKLIATHWPTHSIDYISELLKNFYDDSYFIQGHLHFFFLSHQDAVECYMKALRTGSKLSPVEKGYLLGDLSKAYYGLGDYNSALLWRQESLQLWSVIPGAAGCVATSLVDIGRIEHHKGEFDKALEHFGKALNIEKHIIDNENHDHQENIAAILRNIGLVHNDLGNYSEALSYQLQALNIEEELHGNEARKNMTETLSCIGIVSEKLRNYDSALSYHQKAMELRKQIYGNSVHPIDFSHQTMSIGKHHYQIGPVLS